MNTLEQLQRKKEVLCDLNKKIAACITDEGELESEIYEAEEQETSLLDKIVKVKFFLRPRYPPVDVSPVQSSSNPRTKATQSETLLHFEVPSEYAINASHVSNGSTQQNLTVPQISAPHQYISTEASHHVTLLIPNPISTHAPVPVNNTNATLHHHLQQFESPVAVDMLTNLYVDNVISGCNSHDQAI